MANQYDVIIIGSGAGGGTLARHLAPSGKRILLLERGDWLPREPENWNAEEVFVKNRYVSHGHLVRQERQAVPARRPLLRRRRDQDVRRRALPPAQGGLRRAAGTTTASRRPGPSATTSIEPYYTQGRAAVPGARRARRGSDRAAVQRAVSLPGGVARAAHPAARTTISRGPAIIRSTRPCGIMLDEANMPFSALHPLHGLRRLPLPGPRQVRRRGARRAARRCEHPNVTLLTNAQVRQAEDQRRPAPRSPRWSSSTTAQQETYQGGIVVVSCGAANSAKLLLLSANDKHPARAGQRLRPGRPQLHVPQQPGGAGHLEGAEPDRSTRRRSG